jgi:hypothetical protein
MSKLLVKKPKLPVETWRIILEREGGGVRLEPGLGAEDGREGREEDERIWFEWEGGTVQGWKG